MECSTGGSHVTGHTVSPNIFKRIEIISSIFSDYSSVKLEINYRKKNEKNKNTWKLSNILLKKSMGE